MKAYEELLREFHDKYGQYRRPTNSPGSVPLAVAQLRLRLMVEELGELASSLMKKDLVKTADAICDLAYVTIGTAVAYGTALPELPEQDKVVLRPDQYFLLLTADLGETVTAIHEEQLTRLNDCLTYQMKAILLLSAALKVSFDPCFREVHRSNLTKTVMDDVKDGQKYGSADGWKKQSKGPDFQPPNLGQFLL